ncbi:hypothetical protein EDD11_009596 [Mortierella claussenii]|nr:hypothetical protein EDD11_009596 [Mortierella claussenii]
MHAKTAAENGVDVENDWADDSDLDENDSYYVPSTPFVQKLTALDPSLYSGPGDNFSSEENFDQTSAYINHQLSLHGFPANLQFLRTDKQSASRIVTALYMLLQQRLKDTSYKEEMDLNWRRLSNDYDVTLQNLHTTKSQLEKAERETDILGGRISALEDELRAETEKHRYTREELKSAKANLQYAKTQYAHEARKKEQEMNVLKDKVQRSINKGLSSSSSSIPGGIKILNPVPRTLYGKQHANDAEQLLKEVIEQQRTKEAEVVEENEQLRRTLYTVHVELESLVRKHSTLKSSSTTPYGLPFEMVKDKIESDIRDTLVLLSDQWEHRPSQEPTISPSEIVVRDQRIEDLQKEIEKMQLELEDSTLLVQGAQKMIDNLTSGNFMAGLQEFNLDAEGSDMTLQEIDEAETKVRQQREDLAKERKKFTEACLDLGKKREELERDKQEFEESKRTFRLDKVMSFLSFSPSKPSSSSASSAPRSEKRTTRDHTPPPAPSSFKNGHPSRKRVASSPLPLDMLQTRSVRPKTSTTVVEELLDSDDSSHVLEEHEGSNSQDRHYAFDSDDDEEEETLLKSSTRYKINTSSTVGSGELLKSNHETEQRGRLGNIATAPFSFPSETIPALKSKSTSSVAFPTAAATKEATAFASSPGSDSSKGIFKESQATASLQLAAPATMKPQPFTFTPTLPSFMTSYTSQIKSSSAASKFGTSSVGQSSPSNNQSSTGLVSSLGRSLFSVGSRPSTPSGPTVSAYTLESNDTFGSRASAPVLSTQTQIVSNNGNASHYDLLKTKSGTAATAVGKNSRSSSSMTSTGDASVPLINAAKIPSALSKAAAHLAARKSTSRYPASSTATGTSASTASSARSRAPLPSIPKVARTFTPTATKGVSHGNTMRVEDNGSRTQLPPSRSPHHPHR